MSATTTSLGTTKGPLEAAQKIVADLEGMTNEHRSLAVKFAMETLGIQVSASPPGSAPPIGHVTNPLPPAAPGTPNPRKDIKSFTDFKAPKSDQQFTAVVAYFYQFEAPDGQKRDAIDATTMKEAARQAGRKQVKNWGITLDNAKRSGYLDKGERGEFKLNAVGENLVAITLPGISGSSAGNGSAPKKKPGKSGKKNKAVTKSSAKKG